MTRMDDAAEARADLRSMTLRRCIRFYTTLLLIAIVWSVSRLASGLARGEALMMGAFLLAVVVGVELSSMLVMRDLASAAGPATGARSALTTFSQGPWGSLLAAFLFAVVAVWFYVSARMAA